MKKIKHHHLVCKDTVNVEAITITLQNNVKLSGYAFIRKNSKYCLECNEEYDIHYAVKIKDDIQLVEV